MIKVGNKGSGGRRGWGSSYFATQKIAHNLQIFELSNLKINPIGPGSWANIGNNELP